MKAARLRAAHFAWRGWVTGALVLGLAFARWGSGSPARPAWLALLAAGMAWRAWAGCHIPGHSNGAAFAGPALATGGPYRLSRHPLYFANLLCAAGLVLYAHCLPAWAACAALALAAAHHEALARSEEAYLGSALGEEYLRYRRATPRWPGFPRARGPVGVGAFPRNDPRGGGDGAGWRKAFALQGPNLAKAGASALLIGLASLR